MQRLLGAALVVFLAACQGADPVSPPTAREDLVPAANEIAGRFIVTVRDDVSPVAVAREHGAAPDFVYAHALNGFAGEVSEAARQGLLRDARVLRIEPDGIATITTTQTSAPWGLDRIDQAARPLSGTYTYGNTGAGVTAYIIDTGILGTHNDLSGRVSIGIDTVNDGRNGNDCNGHGTHVAGTVGGETYGVAKDVALVAVRVLNCSGSGTWSGVIAGIDWVAGHHQAGTAAVANMSLGGSANSSVDNAVRNLIGDGVATAVAAGNGNLVGLAQDACKSSPARVGEAMTISATDNQDRKASWANYGSCVDWFAPGVSITSAWIGGDNATKTISGTSMATPHSAGVAALYLQSNPGAAPAAVRNALVGNATPNVVQNGGRKSPNLLLFTSY